MNGVVLILCNQTTVCDPALKDITSSAAINFDVQPLLIVGRDGVRDKFKGNIPHPRTTFQSILSTEN